MAARIENLRDRIRHEGGLPLSPEPGHKRLHEIRRSVPKSPDVQVTGEKVAGTLSFIKEMAGTVPDSNIQTNIQQRIDRILEKMSKIKYKEFKADE